MELKISTICGIVVLIYFSFIMLFSTSDKNRLFIQFIFLTFPFMSITLLPKWGYPTIFSFTTISFFIFLYIPKFKYSFPNKYYLFFLLLFILTIIIGAFKSESLTTNSGMTFLQFLSIFIFSKVVIDECLFDSQYIYIIIKQLKYILVFSLFFLVFQFIFGPDFTFEKSINTNISGGPNTRYPSFFQDPQKYAQFLAIGFFISLIGIKKSISSKISSYILCIAILIAILFTGGRAGFLGFGLGSIILFLLFNQRYKFAILTSFLLLFFILQNYQEQVPLFNRNSTYSDSYEFRSEIWKDAYSIIQRNAYFGIGIGNYARYISIHNPDQFWLNENVYTYFDHPENGYLKYLTEFGSIGFVSILSFIIFPLWSGFKYFIKSKDKISLLLVASIISWLVGFVTVYSFSDTRMFILISVILSLLYVRPKLDLQYD